jgi:hypothetical protein
MGVPVFRGYRRGPDPVRRARTALGLIIVGIGGVASGPYLVRRHTIVVEGVITEGATSPAAIEGSRVRVRISPAGAVASARITLDGAPLEVRTGEDLGAGVGEVLLPALSVGEHRMTVTSGRAVLWRGPARRVVRFVVDDTAPSLSVDPISRVASLSQKISVSGRVADDRSKATDDRPLTVTVNGTAATIEGELFRATLSRAPVGGVRIDARDAAGNQTTSVVDVGVGALLPELRMVAVSTSSWADQVRREALLTLAEMGRINAILLDIKSPDGQLGYVSEVPLAKQVGAVAPTIDLRAAIAQMKQAGLTVVGRVSVFEDPILAGAAWRAGNTRQVVMDRTGQPIGGTPVWTNPLDKDVRNYNLAIAREAADAGADIVVFDRLQRPPGRVDQMAVDPAKIDEALLEVVRGASSVLEETPARIGVTLEVAEDAPEYTAQPIAQISAEVDYVLPVIYPARWTKGSFDVVDPIANPYTIIFRALPDVRSRLGGGARVVPMLQDFSVRIDYGRKQVAAQIQGVANRCLSEFVLVDPKSTYAARSLPVGAPSPTPEFEVSCRENASTAAPSSAEEGSSPATLDALPVPDTVAA